MARISIEDENSDQILDRIQNLDSTTEKGRLQVNTKVVESGLELEEFFQEFKKNLCQISKELTEDMKTYREKLQEQYDCQIEHPQRGHLAIQKDGNSYDYRLGGEEVTLVNGEHLQSKHCPECGKEQSWHHVDFASEDEDINNFELSDRVAEKLAERKEKQQDKDFDGILPSLMFNVCKECGIVFKRPRRCDRFKPEKIEEVNKIGRVYRRTFLHAHASIVNYMENYLGEGRGEWVTEYRYHYYRTGAIRVDMPSLPKNPEEIDICFEQDSLSEPVRPYNSDVRMWKGINKDQERFPLRYRKVLDELATLNNCKVKVFGYKLKWEDAQVIALIPKEPELSDKESEPITDPITPVYGHGYTVKHIEKEAVREHLDSKLDHEEQVENEMRKYEKAAFVEIEENLDVEQK